MSAIFQIEQAENQKSSSCTGEVEFSIDGGKTYHSLGTGCTLDIDWSGVDNFDGDPSGLRDVELSVAYVVTGEGTITIPDIALLRGRSIGIVNHPDAGSLSDREYTWDVDVSDSIDRLVESLERHSGSKPDQILIGASPHMALCINALKKEHYAYLGATGGHTGKGKKGHKRMHRKIFGGWS